MVLGISGHIRHSPRWSTRPHQSGETDSEQQPIHEPAYLHKCHQPVENTSVKHKVYPAQETYEPLLINKPIITNISTECFYINGRPDIHYPIHIPLYQSVEGHTLRDGEGSAYIKNCFRHEKLPTLESAIFQTANLIHRRECQLFL